MQVVEEEDEWCATRNFTQEPAQLAAEVAWAGACGRTGNVREPTGVPPFELSVPCRRAALHESGHALVALSQTVDGPEHRKKGIDTGEVLQTAAPADEPLQITMSNPIKEILDEGRLADSGLARDHDEG